MATLDTTISGDSSNSYSDLAYADSYFVSHVNSTKRDTWAAMSDDEKTSALIQACVMIEALKMTELDRTIPTLAERMVLATAYPYLADVRYPAMLTQYLQLPRNVDVKQDGTYFIPDAAKMAQCEQAVFLRNADESSLVAQRQGIKHDGVNADGVSVGTTYTGNADMYAPMAIQLIRPLLLKTKSLGRR